MERERERQARKVSSDHPLRRINGCMKSRLMLESATFTTVESICVKSGPRNTTAATLQALASTCRSGLIPHQLSRPMSLVAIANRRLTDTPHINTPIMLSSGPNMRHFAGSTMSP